MQRILALFCALLAWVAGANTPTAKDLLAEAQYTGVQISPSGEYLAVTKREGDDNWFAAFTYPERELTFSFNLGDEREIAQMVWVDDEFLVVTPRRRIFADVMGMTGELMSIHVENGRTRNLGRGTVIHTLPNDPEHVLVRASADRFAEVYLQNVRNESRRRVARGAVPRGGFVTDEEGEVVFSTGTNAENEAEVYRRRGNRWDLIEQTPFGEQGWRPFAFGPKPDTYFTWDTRNDGGHAALGLYDDKTRKHQTVFHIPGVDLNRVVRDNDYRIYAVRSDLHYPKEHDLIPSHPLAQIRVALNKSFPNEVVTFTSSTRDNQKAIAYVSGDRNPGKFILVDLEAKKVEQLFAAKPELEAATLAEVMPFELETRDKAKIYGYLTSRADAPRPGPMIINVHGGPHGTRDFWSFSAENQLMAAHGVHVLQVNFRGSGGYGLDYESAGFGRWGGLMQDDVTDATHWAIQNKIADPERICIYGASYGAYSALMGAAREPDLYRCAVGAAGIYDLTIMESFGDVRSTRSGVAFMRRVLGDDAKLESRSPVFLADQITTDVLLAHGAQDRRAPLEHAKRMRDALEKSGSHVEWYLRNRQGHGWFGTQAQLEYYGRLLDFLAPRLGIDRHAVKSGKEAADGYDSAG